MTILEPGWWPTRCGKIGRGWRSISGKRIISSPGVQLTRTWRRIPLQRPWKRIVRISSVICRWYCFTLGVTDSKLLPSPSSVDLPPKTYELSKKNLLEIAVNDKPFMRPRSCKRWLTACSWAETLPGNLALACKTGVKRGVMLYGSGACKFLNQIQSIFSHSPRIQSHHAKPPRPFGWQVL